MCPNPHHRHGYVGFCTKSELPLPRVEKLPNTPIVLRYDRQGTVVGFDPPDGVRHAKFPHLVLAAAFSALTRGIPISEELQTKVDALRAKSEREHAKLTCPHTETYTEHRPFSRATVTICCACGGEVSPGGLVM